MEEIARIIQNETKVNWQWGFNGNFIRFVFPEDGKGNYISINVMYHENKERRFKVVKQDGKYQVIDTEKNNAIVRICNLPTMANLTCENYNKYHEKQGWNQFGE